MMKKGWVVTVCVALAALCMALIVYNMECHICRASSGVRPSPYSQLME